MLFGHQNDDTNQPIQTVPADPAAGVNPLAVDPDTGASLPVAPAEPPTPPEPSEPSVLNQPTAPFSESAPEPGSTDIPARTTGPTEAFLPTSAPAVEPSPFTTSADDSLPANNTSSVNDAPDPQAAPATPSDTRQSVAAASDSSPDALLGLKQQALAQLEPLVDQLDQTPEEKFRTTMMLIQSTDNQSLIQDAYTIAQSITDEKIRAQALLDVINEINYFTQQSSKSQA